MLALRSSEASAASHSVKSKKNKKDKEKHKKGVQAAAVSVHKNKKCDLCYQFGHIKASCPQAQMSNKKGGFLFW